MGTEERQKFVEILLSCLGWPYIYGSNGPGSADCSGLMVWALRSMGKIGKTDDFTAHGFYLASHPTPAPRAGDFAFYGFSGKVSHVVAFIDEKRVISASGGGPKTKSIEIAKQQGACVKIHPGADYRKDLMSYGINLFLEGPHG